MYFDRDKFYAKVREHFGGLNQQQVNGLNRLVAAIENDPHVKDIRWAAYMIATSYHETAHTFHPIHEYGTRKYFISRYGGHTRKGKELGNDTQEEGYQYAGKGDVQLTGESNYERAEIALRTEYPHVVAKWEAETGKTFDLTVGDQIDDSADAKNVMHPEISYAIMSYGMRTGMFTGKKLSDYIKGATCDYPNARRVVNGVDKKTLIAGYAEGFEKALRAAKTSAAQPDPSANTQDTAHNLASATLAAETKQNPPAEIHVDNVENVKVDHTPPPQSEPVTVQVERVSVWAKIGAGFAALTGLGIQVGNVIETKLNEINVVQLGYVLGGVALIAAALWYYDRSQRRAHEKTLEKMKSAADPASNTVELSRAKQ